MTTEMRVRAHPESLLRNILNYFSDSGAYMQELLQNARRAEASEVRVEIDTRAGTVTVTDNGHGVIDPEDLLNIGKSEWNDDVAAERPAGMGLFSVFKLGGLAEVRSGRWKLTLDYAEMCRGKPAVYEGLLPELKGTRVTVARLNDHFGTPDGYHPAGYAASWARQAEFMPFRTTVVLDGKPNVVEPFNPLLVPKDALRVETDWGWIDLCVEEPVRGETRTHATLVQQGIEMEIRHHLACSGWHEGPWVRVYCRPGTVEFTLPDRDRIQDDDKYRGLIKEVRQVCVDAVIDRIVGFEEAAQERLAAVVYAWDKLRAVELPEHLQRVRLRHDLHFCVRRTREQVEGWLNQGCLPCSFMPPYETSFELVPREFLLLPSDEVELFKAMFPGTPVITDIRIDVTADERSDILWHAGDVTLSFDNGEKIVVPPVREQAVLTGGDLEAEFVPDDRVRADFRGGRDFAVVHSCDEIVTCPNLDPWYSFHEESLDGDQAEEAWRTSEYAVHIASTWPGVPALDVTLDEFHTLLRDRYGGDSVRLRDAVWKPEWGNRLNIEAATVEIDAGEKSERIVRLKEKDGFLKEVTG